MSKNFSLVSRKINIVPKKIKLPKKKNSAKKTQNWQIQSMKFIVSQSAYDVIFMCAAIALEGTCHVKIRRFHDDAFCQFY